MKHLLFVLTILGFGAFARAETPSLSAGDAALLGRHVLVKNSEAPFNGKVAKITEIFKDGTLRLTFDNGMRATVTAKNRDYQLALPVGCKPVGQTEICENDSVHYPEAAVTIGLPEGRVEAVFSNGMALVRDGELRRLPVSQLGKEEAGACSSKRPDICRGTYVRAVKDLTNRESVGFEGKVVKLYTDGTALVEAGPLWRQTASVFQLTERTDMVPTASVHVIETNDYGYKYGYATDNYLESPLEEREDYLPIPRDGKTAK
ncbi:MAG: hypothetical protein HUU37_07845 [Bdellovibrionales bacterium]|nr:hypothetical protein [Bdellovibrionales bacterium]